MGLASAAKPRSAILKEATCPQLGLYPLTYFVCSETPQKGKGSQPPSWETLVCRIAAFVCWKADIWESQEQKNPCYQ